MSSGLAMPVLPAVVGSSLMLVPMAVRMVCIQGLRGPLVDGLELAPFKVTMRTWPNAGTETAATAAAIELAAIRFFTDNSLPRPAPIPLLPWVAIVHYKTL